MKYSLYGIILETDLALQQALITNSNSEVDVRVDVEPNPVRISPDLPGGRLLQAIATSVGIEYSTTRADDGTYLLRFHGLADFCISSDLTAVRIYVDHSCDPELLAILVTGNLMATIFTLRGETVLHASAVESGGEAISFVAHSGMCKQFILYIFL